MHPVLFRQMNEFVQVRVFLDSNRVEGWILECSAVSSMSVVGRPAKRHMLHEFLRRSFRGRNLRFIDRNRGRCVRL